MFQLRNFKGHFLFLCDIRLKHSFLYTINLYKKITFEHQKHMTYNIQSKTHILRMQYDQIQGNVYLNTARSLSLSKFIN